MARKKERVDTGGGDALRAENPFAALPSTGLPSGPGTKAHAPSPTKTTGGKGGGARLELRRLKSGKGGKTVTEIRGFPAAAERNLPRLAKELKTRLGVGGSVRPGVIEIQGDHRESVAAFLRDHGFRPVFAGG